MFCALVMNPVVVVAQSMGDLAWEPESHRLKSPVKVPVRSKYGVWTSSWRGASLPLGTANVPFSKALNPETASANCYLPYVD